MIEQHWTDENGYHYVIYFSIYHGYRLGYVGVPFDHALYGVDQTDMPACITDSSYGDITFTDNRDEFNKLTETECPWYIGFDCGWDPYDRDMVSLQLYNSSAVQLELEQLRDYKVTREQHGIGIDLMEDFLDRLGKALRNYDLEQKNK